MGKRYYRPISLTSIVCNIMECKEGKIMEYLRKNSLLISKQYGLMPGRSIFLQIINMLDEWTKMLDVGAAVDVACCDFAKA